VDNSGGATQGTVYVPSGEEGHAGSVYAFGALVYGHQLKVVKTGTGNGTIAGGSVANPTAIECGAGCETTLEDGAVVTLTVSPDSHSTFTGWTGCDEEPSPTECKLTLGVDREVKANFVSHKLTVAKQGPGTGTITSSPAGISCGATCASGFPEGAEVTLSATPDAGSRINDWSGCDQVLGAPGAQECKLTLTADAKVTATFSTKPSIETTIVHAKDTSARFEATINPNLEKTSYQFEYLSEDAYQANGESFTGPEEALLAPASPGSIEAGNSGVTVSAQVDGLTPLTAYRSRLVTSNAAGTSESATRSFTTLISLQSFGTCSNEAFRDGQPVPLPDCRAYEQASSVDKNGGDLIGQGPIVRAGMGGNAVTFQASVPIPGGEGAQTASPLYLGTRGAGGWSTQGILPPQSEGAEAGTSGWTPDLSHVYSWATKSGTPYTTTFLDRTTTTPGTVREVFPHVANAGTPTFPGSSDDGSVVLFETDAAPLRAAAIPNKKNLYVWDRETGIVRVAGVLNNGKAPQNGAFAGPYNWIKGNPSLAGTKVGLAFYTQDEHAIAPDGSRVIFTAAGTGQLYMRLNPTQPQSEVAINGGKEECTQPELACTIHVSASQRTEGTGEHGTDPAGPHPAAFLTATPDVSQVYFTSSEMLTNDANTGPEQPPAQIGTVKPGGSGPEEEDPSLLFKHAVGLTTSPDGEYLYWADPQAGTIGRAKLNGSGTPTEVNDQFIVPGEIEAVADPEKEPGVVKPIPSTPRYVAVDDEYVYWSNPGPLNQFSEAVANAGTIGRAKLNGAEPPLSSQVDPKFIAGLSNPQGIAVNDSHIYWANGRANGAGTSWSISLANLEGKEIKLKYFQWNNQEPRGMTLDGSYLYFVTREDSEFSTLRRLPLEGATGVDEHNNVRERVDGIALQDGYLYWAAEDGAIGRRAVSNFDPNNLFFCPDGSDCEYKYLELEGAPAGLATDGERLYWSVNGEAPANPGNDLYRYDTETGGLTDLAPDSSDEDGAEVLGVLGTSEDGSFVYFAANAVLAEGASQGDCPYPEGSGGECNLYLDHEGQISFIAPLKLAGRGGDADNWRWLANISNGGELQPKTSRVSSDGRTLLFRSSKKLTSYDNEGTSEFYLYRDGAAQSIVCVSCNPTGVPPSGEPALARFKPLGFGGALPPAAVMTRNLSADGGRVFFETSEALVAEDTNGDEGCPLNSEGNSEGRIPACQDIYEWEAKGEGSCESEAQDGGCLYLISSGKSPEPSFLIDASENGNDVFFFTRERLVGQDTDSLVDVYDARVGGGLASQNQPPSPPPCEGEACRRGANPAPQVSSPTTSLFSGPGNPKAQHKKAKPRHKKKRHHGKKYRRHTKTNGRAHR
jgi:hypothetical protein